MPEVHAEFGEMRAKQNVPLRKIVEKECPTRLDRTHAFRDPLPTPLQIVIFRSHVIGIFPVAFAEIERRIGKNSVYDRVPNMREDGQAVTRKKRSERGDIGRRELGARLKIRVYVKDPRL